MHASCLHLAEASFCVVLLGNYSHSGGVKVVEDSTSATRCLELNNDVCLAGETLGWVCICMTVSVFWANFRKIPFVVGGNTTVFTSCDHIFQIPLHGCSSLLTILSSHPGESLCKFAVA